jgi:hypothetical protein
LVVLAGGAVFISATLRKTAQATVDLRDECARLEELRSALAELRHEADITRTSMDRIRTRSDRPPTDR